MYWQNTIIDWKKPKSWLSVLTSWIDPYLSANGLDALRMMGFQDICWDDSDWLKLLRSATMSDIDNLIDRLAEALLPANVKTYHACRVEDAGLYHRVGILVNDPEDLVTQVRRLVIEEELLSSFRPRIDQLLVEFNGINRDKGRLYLVLDDRILIERDGHYLLYGSEWILSLLGPEAHNALRNRGIPTLLHVKLPLRLAATDDLTDLAKTMLQEWTRFTVNSPRSVPKKDFSFCLRENVTPEMIITHTHPENIHDPLHYGVWHKTIKIACASC